MKAYIPVNRTGSPQGWDSEVALPEKTQVKRTQSHSQWSSSAGTRSSPVPERTQVKRTQSVVIYSPNSKLFIYLFIEGLYPSQPHRVTSGLRLEVALPERTQVTSKNCQWSSTAARTRSSPSRENTGQRTQSVTIYSRNSK